MCDIGPIGLSTVRHRPTNFDAGAKVTRIWHPSLPSHLASVTIVQCQRELIRVLRLEVVGTISECSFARSAEHGVYLQPAMLWDISRSPLAGRSLSEESPGRQCYCEGNVGMLPNSSLSCVQSRSSGRSALTRPNKTAGYFVGELQDDVNMTSLAVYSLR